MLKIMEEHLSKLKDVLADLKSINFADEELKSETFECLECGSHVYGYVLVPKKDISHEFESLEKVVNDLEYEIDKYKMKNTENKRINKEVLLKC